MDGEGYFVTGIKSRSFGIRVAVIDEPLVAWLHEKFGGYKTKGGITTSGNQVHVWLLQRQEPLLAVLNGMLPYLVLKRRQAELMIELIHHLRAMPRYKVKSKEISPQQRIIEGRRERRREWKEKGDLLREEIRRARRA